MPMLNRRRNDIKPMAYDNDRRRRKLLKTFESFAGGFVLLICILSCVALGVLWDIILRAHYF
jgi:hypothetical protein